ncbi:MAG: acetyltransferase [Paraglaciecola sp.]|nr:acetyltransferase [Paraglaciecola sp.]NCT47391.1 acetyltransferase [Paraglaciecola sp.]
MITKLLIIGAGGHGKVSADCADVMGCFSQISFMDGTFPQQTSVSIWPIVADGRDVSDFIAPDTRFFVAIGHNSTRQRIMQQMASIGATFATLVHPTAVVSQRATVGAGTLVCANAVVNIASQIGQGCIINTGASVDHDCVLGDYVHIAPGSRLAGSIQVGAGSFIGIGSAIIPGVKIGKNSILGAGSTLLRDLGDASVAVGSPAKEKIKQQ